MAEKQNFESSLADLAIYYGHFFEDENAPFGAEAWNHIFDYETYDIMAIQAKDTDVTGNMTEWIGRKYYDLLEGRDTSSGKCALDRMTRDNFYVYKVKNEKTGKFYFVESLLITYEDRPAVFQKVIDVTEEAYREKVIDEYINIKNLSNTVISILMEETHIMENFDDACKVIGEFFDADRALITDYYSGKLNTTWSRLSQPFTQVCTVLSPDGIRSISEATVGLNYIWVPDVANAEKLDKNLRAYWSSHGIQSILLIPMNFNGTFIGTVSLHNIRSHMNAIDSLKLLGLAVAKCIHSYVIETESEQQLYTDPLTCSMNLSGLKRKTYELLREYPDNQYYFCVMDIRYFGSINRRYGFELGDQILIETARQLEQYMDKDEAFCRISADVFCFVAKYPGEESVRRRFEKFAQSMQCFDELTSVGYTIEYQCGAYVLESDNTVAQAIDKANLARLSLKDEQGSHVLFFSNELLERSKYETELLQDFRPALAHGELTVYYQPQCNYTSQRIAGAEALVRWMSPKHGNVSPADFIPLLERHGMIFELDRFVWEEVCKQQQKWMEMGFECPISVNVSRHDVLRNNICDELSALLDKYHVPKRLLPLEITETAYIKNSEELINVVDMLKDAGFIVEMDDFGSGYSSLNVLKDVSVDLLKLDMKFLDMGDKKGRAGSILNCIVKMTHWLNLGVLAEGVETKEQAEYLKGIGCDLMQGYYFARPVPAGNFERMLMTCIDDISNMSQHDIVNAACN